MLGRVEIAGDPDEIITKHDLGPDALDIDADEFQQLIGGRRGTIKSALMNQRILSGIGNIYTDEILFQSGVHPRTKPGDLDSSGLSDLYEAMRSVLTQSIDAHADPAQMLDSFLLPHRAEGEACPNCSEKIATTKISGRRTFYCPQCQPRQES